MSTSPALEAGERLEFCLLPGFGNSFKIISWDYVMLKTTAEGDAQSVSQIDPAVLQLVNLEVWCTLLDNVSNNKAFQVLVSRNEIGARKARKAFLEVMQQHDDGTTRHKLLVKIFGLFLRIGRPDAGAMLGSGSTVDIEVTVLTGKKFKIHLLTYRQLQKGPGPRQLFATCPGALEWAGRLVQLAHLSEGILILAMAFCMGHVPGQANQ